MILTLDSIWTIVLSVLIPSIITGIGISVGFWLAARMALKEIRKDVPGWIHEINIELRKQSAIDKALTYQRQSKT